MKLKNKATKDNKFLCGGPKEQRVRTTKGCGTEVTVGSLVHGIVFCLKCGVNKGGRMKLERSGTFPRTKKKGE